MYVWCKWQSLAHDNPTILVKAIFDETDIIDPRLTAPRAAILVF